MFHLHSPLFPNSGRGPSTHLIAQVRNETSLPTPAVLSPLHLVPHLGLFSLQIPSPVYPLLPIFNATQRAKPPLSSLVPVVLPHFPCSSQSALSDCKMDRTAPLFQTLQWLPLALGMRTQTLTTTCQAHTTDLTRGPRPCPGPPSHASSQARFQLHSVQVLPAPGLGTSRFLWSLSRALHEAGARSSPAPLPPKPQSLL